MTDKTTPGAGHNSAGARQMLADEPNLAFTEEGLIEQFLTDVAGEVDDYEADVSTEAGRRELKSMAAAMASERVRLDDAGKKLNENRRKENDAVNLKRNKLKDTLKLLQSKLRAPLTEWEAEQERKGDKIQSIRERIAESYELPSDLTALQIALFRDEIAEIEIDPELFGALAPDIEEIKSKALAHLLHERSRVEQLEADQKELAQRREADEQRARDEQEKKAKEAEAARERERIAAEAKKVSDAAELKIKADAQAEIDAANEKAAAAQKAADEAEATAQKERERIEAEKREQAERDADEIHRRQVIDTATAALIEQGLKPADAKAAMSIIAAGTVPGVSVHY